MIEKTCKTCGEGFEVSPSSSRRIYCDACRYDNSTRKPKRRGVFVGGYVPAELKRALQQKATSEHRTVSQQLARIIEAALMPPRLARSTDPLPQRRAG